MGHNVDFVSMCGAPSVVKCPKCRRKTRSGLDDYDIDCGHDYDLDTNNEYDLDCTCETCEHEFKIKLKLKCKAEIEKYDE